MVEECIFCRIVAGELPSNTVCEGDDVLAFLDANPLTRGHTLVVPRAHHERLGDLPPATAAAMGEALATMTPAVEEAVDAPATTVAYNNGPEAGQEIDHVHAHVVPRFGDDGAGPVHALFRRRPDLSDDEMAEIGHEISERV